MTSLDHIYIIVSQQFEADRIPTLRNMLREGGIPDERVTFFEPFYKGRDDINIVRKMIKPPLIHHISEGAGFLYLSFYKLMRTFLASKHQTILVLESDVLAQQPTEWPSQLDTVIRELQTLPDWRKSITFCGNGCGLEPSPETRRGTQGILYEMNSSKCCDSMIWQRDAIADIVDHMLPMNGPIDIWLAQVWYPSSVAKSKQHKAYWIKPTIFMQGSQNGTYASNVQ